jgi:hypothetical protein
MALRSGYGSLPITRLRRPPSLSMPLPVLRPTPTSPNPKTLLLPLPATALYPRLSVSGVHCIRRRGSRVGSGPALEHRNRPHPSGGGGVISRPYAFWTLKNTRIAYRQHRSLVPLSFWQVLASMSSNSYASEVCCVTVGRHDAVRR